MAELVAKAHTAITPKNIMAGFKATGIFPLNRSVFSDEDYLAAAVTDRTAETSENRLQPELYFTNQIPDADTASVDACLQEQNDDSLPDANNESNQIVEQDDQNDAYITSTDEHTNAGTSPSEENSGNADDMATSSSMIAPTTPTSAVSSPQPQDSSQTSSDLEVSNQYISSFELFEIPLAGPRKTKKTKARKGKSRILSSTPEKKRLETEAQLRKEKDDRLIKKADFEKRKKLEKLRKKLVVSTKTTRVASSGSSDESTVLIKKDLKNNFAIHTSDEADDTDLEEIGCLEPSVDKNCIQCKDQWFCCFCGEDYGNSKPKERWVRCSCRGCSNCVSTNSPSCSRNFCQSWAHCLCSHNPMQFICIQCDS